MSLFSYQELPRIDSLCSQSETSSCKKLPRLPLLHLRVVHVVAECLDDDGDLVGILGATGFQGDLVGTTETRYLAYTLRVQGRVPTSHIHKYTIQRTITHLPLMLRLAKHNNAAPQRTIPCPALYALRYTYKAHISDSAHCIQ